MKILFGFFIVISILFLVTFQSGMTGGLEVHFFDVGQGDAILIRTPANQNIIIDGGPDNSFMAKLGQALPFYDKTIDLMILTHPHDDHIFGLVEVLKRYQVNQVLYTGVLHPTQAYLDWLSIIKEKEIPLRIALAGQEFVFDEVKLKIIYPFKDFTNQKVENLNNTSIVTQLIYSDVKVLFTGDLEFEAEEGIIQSSIINPQSLVLKSGHHGSGTSSSEEFLKKIMPKYAIIMAGKDNKFGHPSLRTLARYERLNTKVFRTDLNGDILLQTNGHEVLLTPARP